MGDQSNPHHLVLGKLNDFLTGIVIPDTLDERYRQKIAKKLVSGCGFKKNDIKNNINLKVAAGNRKAAIKVDFLVKYREKIIIIIKFAPGSLVTRRLSTLALSRIIKPYQIPIVIITNGEDAEIMDGSSGKVIATGLENLPGKEHIKENMDSFLFNTIEKLKFDQASRIAYACEIDGACPCDSDVCIIE
ncbi:MAG: type I restriction enzyme HsdR N-terminal domain-containing protein [Deltaproteobacteria bacterium]|nr:type I restriction enzyme HsdR N-terminal domain-containing protein [Deltaproteobacteria bacterium]